MLGWGGVTVEALAEAMPADYYAAAVAELGEEQLRVHLGEALDRCHADHAAYVETFPSPDAVFTALRLCPLDRVRAVIVGQDPYIKRGQAHGLAFSVLNGKPPPSLLNVIRRATEDLGRPCSGPVRHGDLSEWAAQGVLLLNRVLTVRAGKSASHTRHDQGWMPITRAWIRHIVGSRDGVVFMLWGNAAHRALEGLDAAAHLVLAASHPSPLGCRQTDTPFIKARHFSECNAYLTKRGHQPISW